MMAMFYKDGYIYWSASKYFHFKSDLNQDVTTRIDSLPDRPRYQIDGNPIRFDNCSFYVGPHKVYILRNEKRHQSPTEVSAFGHYISYWDDEQTHIIDCRVNDSYRYEGNLIHTPGGFYRIGEMGTFRKISTKAMEEYFNLALIKTIHLS